MLTDTEKKTAIVISLIVVLVSLLSKSVWVLLLGGALVGTWAAYDSGTTAASTLGVECDRVGCTVPPKKGPHNAVAERTRADLQNLENKDRARCLGAPHADGKACIAEDCQQYLYSSRKKRKLTPSGDVATPEREYLPPGSLCGVGPDPNFATFTQRQMIEDDGDHYIPDGMVHLYDDAETRIYHRDRNQLMAARQMLNGSTRPKTHWSVARQGWNIAAFGGEAVKSTRYMELVDASLGPDPDFKERNF